MERLLGTDDLTERLPFSLSKIQEMARAGEISMVVFPGSRKYVILESVFENWIRRTYRNGVNRLDQGQALCESDDQQEALSPKDSSHFTISSGKVAIKIQPSDKRRKTQYARSSKAIVFKRGNIR